MPVKVPKKKGKPAMVFVPSKPWSAAERSGKFSLHGGKIFIPARFFERVFVQGHGKVPAASAETLNELFSSPHISPEVRRFAKNALFGTQRTFSRQTIAKRTGQIAQCLDRRKISPKLFTFLEDLRVFLIGKL